MKRIALVGDIGSGKTFFSKLFRYPVFNADLVVSNLYQKDQFLFRKIKKKFPSKISNFPLKKEELLRIIFHKQKNLNTLSKIIHPIVRKKMKNFLFYWEIFFLFWKIKICLFGKDLKQLNQH